MNSEFKVLLYLQIHKKLNEKKRKKLNILKFLHTFKKKNKKTTTKASIYKKKLSV